MGTNFNELWLDIVPCDGGWHVGRLILKKILKCATLKASDISGAFVFPRLGREFWR
mgnify:CR=1 FL=1